MGQNWIESFKTTKARLKGKGPVGHVYFLGAQQGRMAEQLVQKKAPAWQKNLLKKSERELIYFISAQGPYWIFKPNNHNRKNSCEVAESDYAWARDSLGSLVSQFKAHQLSQVQMHFHGTSEAQDLGALVGFELAVYSFKDGNYAADKKLPQVHFEKKLGDLKKNIFQEAATLAAAVNQARHFVNMPPNELNPKTFPVLVKNLGWSSKTKIEVWDHRRLAKEKMGLHSAVGQGAEHLPCLVHLKYRPKKTNLRPIAFVGKGITFDTGGLDIKPSAGMRWMKKDMGGAAAVASLAWWVDQSGLEQPCDFYLALAENSVDAKAMRPGDVFTARNGMKVEIDNTDAEGRLVLADAIDVAVTQSKSDHPEIMIDVATLTGAIKVALGAEMAGLFTNDDFLAEELKTASYNSGDLVWRMPLFDKYFSGMSSAFADFKNSAEGFGGAITAALFLQKFIRDVKWAHLDIYAWTDKGTGVMPGGMANGQAVQLLAEFLKKRVSSEK